MDGEGRQDEPLGPFVWARRADVRSAVMLTAGQQDVEADRISVAGQSRSALPGVLTRFRRWWSRRGRTRLNPDDPAFNLYRSLARQLLADFPCADGGRTIIVTSVTGLPTETLLTMCYFMRDELGSSILAVDGAGRDDGLGGRLGQLNLPGLLDLLHSDDKRLTELVRPTGRPGIAVLPPGRPPGEGPVAIRAARVERFFAEARHAFDYVIIQQSAILEDRSFLRFAAAADAVLLLVEEGRTNLDDLAQCRAVLEGYHVENVRVVLCATR
jgi:hypothetical protein